MSKKIPQKAYKEKEKRNEIKKAQVKLDLNNITPKLSQSLVKELYKYKLKEECGLRIEAKYITKSVEFPSSEAQELGNYFEYKATGQLPRDGHTPEPILLKTGKPSIDYQRMDSQVENFKRIMKRLNFSIEQTGFTFTNPKYSGITDIIAHDNNIKTKVANKKRIIIDLKTSGLLHDKWSEYGWADESIEEKDGLMIQAIHYKLLAKYEWGIEDIPFYFMIFSSKNDWEYKVFKVNVDEATLQIHYNNLLNVKKFLDDTMSKGWTPYPKFAVCKECPLADNCKHFTDIPAIQEIYL
jgi:hypothetical protein